MTYTISEFAKKLGLTAYTLRYYEKEGLLPFVERINGRRVFKDEDFTKCERKAPKFIYGDISSLKNNDSISLFFIVLYF